ncbi:putative strictosidine synthase [Helianthus annuus]|nr:putative strictosidine synthase [Helianthus annuus]
MATLQMRKLSLISACVAFPYIVVVSCQYDKFSKLELPQGVTGPGSAAFRGVLFTEGPFTTVTDGRILKWLGPNIGFVDFAYTSPTRSCLCIINQSIITFMLGCKRTLRVLCSCSFV